MTVRVKEKIMTNGRRRANPRNRDRSGSAPWLRWAARNGRTRTPRLRHTVRRLHIHPCILIWIIGAAASNNIEIVQGIRTGRVNGPRGRRALRAVLAGPTRRAVAEVVALRCVARSTVAARRVRAMVTVVLRHHTLILYSHLVSLQCSVYIINIYKDYEKRKLDLPDSIVRSRMTAKRQRMC